MQEYIGWRFFFIAPFLVSRAAMKSLPSLKKKISGFAAGGGGGAIVEPVEAKNYLVKM